MVTLPRPHAPPSAAGGPTRGTGRPRIVPRAVAAALAAGLGGIASEPGASPLGPVVVRPDGAWDLGIGDRGAEPAAAFDSVFDPGGRRAPTLSLPELLQPAASVQFGRDRGDASALAIRGLSQVSTTLDGRELFSARLGRALDTRFWPTEGLASVAVRRWASADQVEGGLGGAVLLRSHLPLSLPPGSLWGSWQLQHADVADRGRASGALMLSHRWSRPDGEAFGVLLGVSDQRRAFREDQLSLAVPVRRAQLIAGRDLLVPGAVSQTRSEGEHRLVSRQMTLQWQPEPTVVVTWQTLITEYRTRQDSSQIGLGTGTTALDGSLVVRPGTDEVERITWLDAPVSLLRFARDTRDRTRTVALGATGRQDSLRWRVDASRIDSDTALFFSGPFAGATASRVTVDVSPQVPTVRPEGLDLATLAGFRYTGLAYRANRIAGSMPVLQLDLMELAPPPVPGLSKLQAGVRLARRQAGNAPGLIVADAPLSGPEVGGGPLATVGLGGEAFLGGLAGGPGLSTVPDLSLARDAAGLRTLFGLTTPLPTAGAPLAVWSLDERTQGAYLLGRFAEDEDTRTGLEIGLRAVQTRLTVAGSQSVPSSGAIEPLEARRRDLHLLPSLQARWPGPGRSGWVLAMSRTLARPDPAQLSPSLTLVPNAITPELNQGSAGNPDLRPVRSDNVDLGWEQMADPRLTVRLTAFAKAVDGFVLNASEPERHDGQTYQVTRPRNGGRGRVRGLELGAGGRAPFDGPWSGLSWRASATRLASRTQLGDLGPQPLPNLSTWSAGLLLRHDTPSTWASLSVNARDRYLASVTSIVGLGRVPVYAAPQAWADATLGWRPAPQVAVSLSVGNLTRSRRESQYGTAAWPESRWWGDRTWTATVQLTP